MQTLYPPSFAAALQQHANPSPFENNASDTCRAGAELNTFMAEQLHRLPLCLQTIKTSHYFGH